MHGFMPALEPYHYSLPLTTAISEIHALPRARVLRRDESKPAALLCSTFDVPHSEKAAQLYTFSSQRFFAARFSIDDT